MNNDPLFDLEGDKKVGKVEPRQLLEKDIEQPVCRYARERYRMKVEKFTSPARRSVPDDIFSMEGGNVFFIEFKAPGKTPTPSQSADHDKRRDLGFMVFVVDDIEQGKKVVDKMYTYFTTGVMTP